MRGWRRGGHKKVWELLTLEAGVGEGGGGRTVRCEREERMMQWEERRYGKRSRER